MHAPLRKTFAQHQGAPRGLIRVLSRRVPSKMDEVMQLASLKKNFAGMGFKLPEDVEPHVKLTNRSLEIWMVSLGLGLAPDIQMDLLRIWQTLNISQSQLLPAMTELREMAARQQEYTGVNIFDQLDVTDTQWVFLCSYRPSWS